MNKITFESSNGDGDEPLCITCGFSLPTPVSSRQSEIDEFPLEPADVPELEEVPPKCSPAVVADPEKVISK